MVRRHFHERVDESPRREKIFGTSGYKIRRFVSEIWPFEVGIAGRGVRFFQSLLDHDYYSCDVRSLTFPQRRRRNERLRQMPAVVIEVPAARQPGARSPTQVIGSYFQPLDQDLNAHEGLPLQVKRINFNSNKFYQTKT